ncbi:MAG: hypothetical protein ACLT4C_07085 [Butyricicoccus sp.]
MPLLLNNSNGGSDWADRVTAKQVCDRQSRTEKGSAYLYELTDTILQAVSKGAEIKNKKNSTELTIRGQFSPPNGVWVQALMRSKEVKTCQLRSSLRD